MCSFVFVIRATSTRIADIEKQQSQEFLSPCCISKVHHEATMSTIDGNDVFARPTCGTPSKSQETRPSIGRTRNLAWQGIAVDQPWRDRGWECSQASISSDFDATHTYKHHQYIANRPCYPRTPSLECIALGTGTVSSHALCWLQRTHTGLNHEHI